MTRIEVIDGREFVVTVLPDDQRIGQERERALLNSRLTSRRIREWKLTPDQKIRKPRRRRRKRR